MTMTKWAPFRAFTELEQEMHTLLDHFGARSWLEGFGWRPDTDISRDGSTLVVEIDLPGIDPYRDVHIDLVDNVLRIEGDRREARPVSDADRYIHERPSGSFHRSVMLPDGVRAETISARYENGTLSIRVPVLEAPAAGNDRHQVPIRTTEWSGT
jgi:HSP20 family protein